MSAALPVQMLCAEPVQQPVAVVREGDEGRFVEFKYPASQALRDGDQLFGAPATPTPAPWLAGALAVLADIRKDVAGSKFGGLQCDELEAQLRAAAPTAAHGALPEAGERIWTCKIGGFAGALPHGADAPMRRAVEAAFREMTGADAEFNFTGWGGSPTENERYAIDSSTSNGRAISGAALSPASPAPAVPSDDPFRALRCAFITSESNGSAGVYELRAKFRNLSALHAAHRELLAALAATPAQQTQSDAVAAAGWMPIETAPKTSRAILVWCPERQNTYAVCWSFDKWEHFGGAARPLYEMPTLWQPLPAAPGATPPQQATPAWEPEFDATSHEQEKLAIDFCAEIAGPLCKRGRLPDPVRLLEMAEALYQAERRAALKEAPGGGQ